MKKNSYRLDDFLYDLEQEIKAIKKALASPNTWIAAGVLAGFLVLAYFALTAAIKYDGLLQLMNKTQNVCRPMGNAQYLTLIYLSCAFALTAAYCFGNLANYFTAKRKEKEKADAGRFAAYATWGGLAALICGGLVAALLNYWC
jgi:hypothetical protein